MKELASSMPGKVVFAGFQSYENIPSILNFCDIAVVPSIWEDPFPTTVLEGLAAGLPLVVTRSGGIPEAVDENCAIILEKDNNLPSNLSNAILSLYNNKNRRTQMSKHAKERSILLGKEKYASEFLECVCCD